jgi:tetrahydromethanopterin S-methyltransferase subunit G
MRDGEQDEPSAAIRHNELRDIHHRIDSLKEENERQFGHLIERLHAMEVAIAAGSRFPATAWVAAAGIFLTILGTGFMTFNKLETAAVSGAKAISLIETHMAGSSARFQTIQEATTFMDRWSAGLPLLEERVKVLEGRVVGQGPEGWHRRDHDLYAKMIDERNDRIRSRLDTIEKKQEALCERVRECAKMR